MRQCCCLVAKACPTLCNTLDYSPPDYSVLGIFQARILEGCDFLLQGIFTTQGLNPHLLLDKQTLPLSHLGAHNERTENQKNTQSIRETWDNFNQKNIHEIVVPWAGSFAEGHDNPLQSSCLENPMDGGAWWAAVHGVTNSWTWLRAFPFTFHFHALEKEMATPSSVLAWRIPGTGEPGGLPSMGSHRVGHDWSDLAAAAARTGVREKKLLEQSFSKFDRNLQINPQI